MPMRKPFRHVIVAVLFAGFLGVASTQASAAALAHPEGRVILVVSGAIEHTNAGGEARFDRSMLESIELTTLVTTTPWTEGDVRFQGILARDLMAAVGAGGEHVFAVALNDYKIRLPLSDFQEHNVLLAISQDGKRKRVRDKGPIWVIYPVEPGERSQSMETREKMIWQVKTLRIQ